MIREYKKSKYFFLELCVMLCISYILSSDLAGVSKDIKNIYLYCFSYQFIGQDISIMRIITAILPMVVMISMFGDSFSYELDKNAAYIFTRTKKRAKWLLDKLVEILVQITLTDVLIFIIAFIFFSFLGYRIIDFKEFINITFKILTTLILSQYILIIIANLISIKMDSSYGYIISNLIYIICILNSYYLALKKIILLKYIPLTQQFITLQDNKFINRNVKYFSKYIIGYRFSEAIIYDIVILIIIMLMGIRQIRKAEFY